MNVSDFLAKLVENSPQLFVLVLGTILLALSGASELPLSSGSVPMAVQTRVLCGVVGIGLILYSLWALYGNEKVRRSEKDKILDEQIILLDEKTKDINRKDEEITELKDVINTAKNLAKEKGDNEILEILNGISLIAATEEGRSQVLSQASDWIKIKTDADVWTDALESSEFSEYGITNQNIQEFRDEIKQHLKALQENLQDMLPDGIPRKRGVSQKVASSRLAYKRAMMIISRKIDPDLKNSYELDDSVKEQIKAYMERFVDVVDD